ncbi:hypothetical protein C2R22_10725 [Salinigranum rubrum]|uniref:YvrJ family protein n=1 Tax=Salinigranum rubrum TaxID=755307 RepID=A0A2I8VJF2_9EURY|nr:hypothetical protein [Salinigranum rubrum]AUV82063.1 hypothetical protein C2R22_10725 [Salinigranum rubrum]
MSELTDIIIQATDPVTALLVIAIGYEIWSVKKDLQQDVEVVRQRVRRIESAFIETDGGGDDGER